MLLWEFARTILFITAWGSPACLLAKQAHFMETTVLTA